MSHCPGLSRRSIQHTFAVSGSRCRSGIQIVHGRVQLRDFTSGNCIASTTNLRFFLLQLLLPQVARPPVLDPRHYNDQSNQRIKRYWRGQIWQVVFLEQLFALHAQCFCVDRTLVAKMEILVVNERIDKLLAIPFLH